MTKHDFFRELEINGIDPSSISFNDSIQDGYGIRHVYFHWEIYFRERGVEFNTRGYPSQSDALQALLRDILEHR